MDRRSQKTKKAIYDAFVDLLKHENYHHITVQQIIDKADVGRSTFYSHFETKDDLLQSLFTELFVHIFSDDFYEEESHDFSKHNDSLRERIMHILYHLKDNKDDVMNIFACESGQLLICGEFFIRFFEHHLEELFDPYVEKMDIDVPRDFLMNYLIGSFTSTVQWWIQNDMLLSPKTVSDYYMNAIRLDL